MITDYEEALQRIQISRIQPKEMQRKSDIERIFFARGQENQYPADELYGIFDGYDADKIAAIRRDLNEKQWHLMKYEDRINFIMDSSIMFSFELCS